MKTLSKTNENGYRITPDTGVYYIYLQDEKANVGISYEYDASCGTLEDVEKELQEHTFNEIRKLYREQCVYCECVEQLY